MNNWECHEYRRKSKFVNDPINCAKNQDMNHYANHENRGISKSTNNPPVNCAITNEEYLIATARKSF